MRHLIKCRCEGVREEDDLGPSSINQSQRNPPVRRRNVIRICGIIEMKYICLLNIYYWNGEKTKEAFETVDPGHILHQTANFCQWR